MSISESHVLECLKKIFPSGIVYADLYIHQPASLTFAVYKLAKASQLGRVEWLASKGFTWKETGYIEPDMRVRTAVEAPLESQQDRPYQIAHYIFSTFPLAGEYRLSNEEDALLYQSARETVQKMLKGNVPVKKREEIVLVLETVELLKNWSGILADGADGIFWKYIFLQYGFNADNSDAAEKRLYGHFRAAIKSTLKTYKRFFAPKGTQRYYTSLLLHAIAPKQSINSLFNILFDFYVKNLDFQYVHEDISYKVFTKGMRARWDSNYSVDDSMRLRSDAVFSGLQTLFKERPGYMASLCDSIVQKMDALLRGEGKNRLDTERNYWDYLLFEWYQQKSVTERVKVQREHRRRKVEYIATSADKIYIRYTMDHTQVGLALPRIRLASVGVRRPVLSLYQSNHCIFEEELSVTGNDLCLTTQSKFIALERTGYDPAQPLMLYAEISYMGDILYSSGQALSRKYILFDANGNEGPPKGETSFLFTGSDAAVEFSSEDGVYQIIHPGQLYQLNLSEIAAVSVDGAEIFADEETSSQIRHYASMKQVKGLHIRSQGKYTDVYDAPVSFKIMLPEQDHVLKYQLSLDGQRYGMDQVNHSGHELEVPDLLADGVLHTIRVIDISTDIVRYELNYIVLEGCRAILDKPIYRSGVDTATVKFVWNTHESEIVIPVVTESSLYRFYVAGLPYEFELDIPGVQCTFMGMNGFMQPQTLWHREISAADFLTLDVPSGWKGKVCLGTHEIGTVDRENLYEVGNVVRSVACTSDEADLVVALTSEVGDTERYFITKVVFQPRFTTDPLSIEEERLKWRPQNNFIGDKGSRLVIRIALHAESVESFEASTTEAEFALPAKMANGQYPYAVFLKKRSVFVAGTERQLFTGILTKGDPNEFLFSGKELQVRDCLCWDFDTDSLKQIYMRPGCGILRNLAYLGRSVASGETVANPCYSATMFYTTNMGDRIPFNFADRPGFEIVNPVKIWIINGHILILRCATEDAVYIDKRFSTIVNKSPDAVMSKYEQSKRLETPDYFEYEVREEQKDV